MEDIIKNFDNSKLLLLIEDWLNGNGQGKTYENVIMELLHGNSCLFVQTHGEQIKKLKTYVTVSNEKLKMGIYVIEGKNYYGAFTDLNLLEQWLKVGGSYARLPSRALLEMADKTEIEGIVINSSFRNMFVSFRNNKVK